MCMSDNQYEQYICRETGRNNDYQWRGHAIKSRLESSNNSKLGKSVVTAIMVGVVVVMPRRNLKLCRIISRIFKKLNKTFKRVIFQKGQNVSASCMKLILL